jgi:glycosyltransferase involved in cell wall biosynthesis
MEPRSLAGLSICFVAGTLAKGGAEQQLYYMLRALHHSGARVRLICLTSGEFWEQPIQQLGVPVRPVGGTSSRLRRLVRIVRELRMEPAQIVQSAHFYTNGYALVAARLTGAGEIGAIRCDVHSEMAGPYGLARRLTVSNMRRVAANSRAAVRTAEKFGATPSRLRFLPNVVETNLFRPSELPRSPVVRILGAGRLTAQKRFDRFLSVLAQVKDSVSHPVQAVLAGTGPLQSELEQQATRLGLLPDGVQFCGPVTQMLPVYQQADILLLTSDYEGTPNVVLEAMACGLPVVATRVGGVPEIVTDGETGYLADPGDDDRLACVLRDLVCSSDLRNRIGHAARSYVLANHSTDKLAGYLQNLYYDSSSRIHEHRLAAAR